MDKTLLIDGVEVEALNKKIEYHFSSKAKGDGYRLYYSYIVDGVKYEHHTNLGERFNVKNVTVKYLSFLPDKHSVKVEFLDINSLNFVWLIYDKADNSKLYNSYAILKISNHIDTIFHGTSNLIFNISKGQKCAVEFAAEGYNSKTILFNTQYVNGVNVDYPIISDMKMMLYRKSFEFRNDTVANFEYDKKTKDFEFHLNK